MWSALQFEFMKNALLSGVIISVLCGIIGTLIVVNRLVFMAGGIAHAAYGGVGLAIYTGIPPFIGASIFSFITSIVMGIVTIKDKHRADTVIGVLWAIGMAIGIIFSDLSSGYNVDLMGYLFGSILSVPKTEIYVAAIFTIMVIVGVYMICSLNSGAKEPVWLASTTLRPGVLAQLPQRARCPGDVPPRRQVQDSLVGMSRAGGCGADRQLQKLWQEISLERRIAADRDLSCRPGAAL